MTSGLGNFLNYFASPLATEIKHNKTAIKILVAIAVFRFAKKKYPAIKSKWDDSAQIRSIAKFAINQYFSSPNSNDIMAEQHSKYENVYTKHYSRNATTIACKFSLKTS
eukprot:393235_1